ncbi:MAG: cytochrome C [Planctomycetota bacterium]|nr:MAG: cytochrome C [Planctomycetota bacterium]
MLIGSILFFVVGLQDRNFFLIATKPDNVPIAGMLLLVGFFTWLAFRRAVINDDLRDRGEPNLEERASRQKVFTWPDLVYSELIALMVTGAILVVWSIYLKAPIEEPAAPALSPNPAKAPWYFLGLQEMLVYFDPWLAGVVFPSMIIVGLQALPYIDRNPKGNGYYTFKERPFAIAVFMFGFMILWISLVVLGTFLRGPNWSFFGPFDYWDHSKLEPLINVDLSELFWVYMLGQPLPDFWLVREFPGILLIVLYLGFLPILLAKTWFKKMFIEIGFARYMVMIQLFLFMALLPIKMILRWTFNLKYLVHINEFFLNI